MSIAPNITRRTFFMKECAICRQSFGPENFAPVRSFYYPDGHLPVCNSCINKHLEEVDWDWEEIDKLCQMADIPFVPREWERLKEINLSDPFGQYAQIFLSSEYDNLGWHPYYEAFKTLRDQGRLEQELPAINEQKLKEQRERWGSNYDQEALDYLDNLFNGLITTQNVNGALQIDQALKICKMSYEIDNCIRSGEQFDKLLGSYDKMVKAAEFTPKNVKNLNDFDTSGELIKWLEKNGWRNTFYDGVTRDVVDETIKNIQNFNQRLYTNETGIAEEIQRRVEQLKVTQQMESYYDTNKNYDLDTFDNDGYNDLLHEEEEEFDPGTGDARV